MLGFRAWAPRIPTTTRRVSRIYTSGKNLSLAPEYVDEQIIYHKDNIRLGAIAHNKTWPTSYMEASCLSPSKLMMHKPGEKAPAQRCMCGIYAFYDYDQAKEETGASILIPGVVQGWGKIQLHQDGFRSEFMQILGFVDYHSEYADYTAWAERVGVELIGVTQTEAYEGYKDTLVRLSKKYAVPILGEREARAMQKEFSSDWKDRIFKVDPLTGE